MYGDRHNSGLLAGQPDALIVRSQSAILIILLAIPDTLYDILMHL